MLDEEGLLSFLAAAAAAAGQVGSVRRNILPGEGAQELDLGVGALEGPVQRSSSETAALWFFPMFSIFSTHISVACCISGWFSQYFPMAIP